MTPAAIRPPPPPRRRQDRELPGAGQQQASRRGPGGRSGHREGDRDLEQHQAGRVVEQALRLDQRLHLRRQRQAPPERADRQRVGAGQDRAEHERYAHRNSRHRGDRARRRQHQAHCQHADWPSHGPHVTPGPFLPGRMQQRRQHHRADRIRCHPDRGHARRQADGQPRDRQQRRGRTRSRPARAATTAPSTTRNKTASILRTLACRCASLRAFARAGGSAWRGAVPDNGVLCALASGSGRAWCGGSEAEVVRVGQRVPGTVIRRPGSRFRCR